MAHNLLHEVVVLLLINISNKIVLYFHQIIPQFNRASEITQILDERSKFVVDDSDLTLMQRSIVCEQN